MATKAREGIGTDCSATVIHGENPTGKPQAVATDANGILLAKLDGVTIEHAHLDVQLKANETTPAESDSVIACGTTDGAIAGPPKAIKVGADGTVQTAGTATVTGTVTAQQSVAANLNMTEASGTTIAGRLVDSAAASVAENSKNIKAAVEILDDVVGTDRTDTVAKCAAIGGKATDATSLPADTTAARLVELLTDLKGVLLTRNAYLAAGEDLTVDVQKVEHRYSYATNTAQAQVKATAGLLHSFRCNCTTAGTITIYDNPAEAGTAIDTIPMAIGEHFSHVYDVGAGTGLYVGFDATWAGSWNASYR